MPRMEPAPLFSPNNHSTWRISYRAVDEQRSAHLRDIVDTQYAMHIDTIISIEQVDEAEVNSNNFKISGEKNAERVKFLLRRLPASRPRSEIERRVGIMRLLGERGIVLPCPLPARGGGFVLDGADERFVMFDFISGDHYRGTREEFVDAGKIIGALDRELLALTPKYEDDVSFRFSEAYASVREFSVPIWEDIFAKAAVHAETEGTDSFGKQLLSRREEIMSAVAGLGTAPKGTFQLAHFDLHPHNLLADGKAVLAVLDFDSVRHVEKMRAAAFAIHRLVRQHIVHTQPSDIATAVKEATAAFIAAYRSEHALTDEEAGMIPYFIRHESLSRLTNAMKEYANTGSSAWKQDLTKQLSNIGEAAFFA